MTDGGGKVRELLNATAIDIEAGRCILCKRTSEEIQASFDLLRNENMRRINLLLETIEKPEQRELDGEAAREAVKKILAQRNDDAVSRVLQKNWNDVLKNDNEFIENVPELIPIINFHRATIGLPGNGRFNVEPHSSFRDFVDTLHHGGIDAKISDARRELSLKKADYDKTIKELNELKGRIEYPGSPLITIGIDCTESPIFHNPNDMRKVKGNSFIRSKMMINLCPVCKKYFYDSIARAPKNR